MQPVIISFDNNRITARFGPGAFVRFKTQTHQDQHSNTSVPKPPSRYIVVAIRAEFDGNVVIPTYDLRRVESDWNGPQKSEATAREIELEPFPPGSNVVEAKRPEQKPETVPAGLDDLGRPPVEPAKYSTAVAAGAKEEYGHPSALGDE